MIRAMVNEIQDRKSYLEGKTVETIYFGGGTPSLLTKTELRQILDEVYRHFQVDENPEITLEANPDDCSEENLKSWKEVGINRLSIGLQSFKSYDLEWMNRAHTADESIGSIRKAQKAGFTNLTADLMYGLPQLTDEEWRSHILQLIDMEIPHISSYCLTVESNTVLDNWVEKGKIAVADEDRQSRQFEILVETLEANGIIQYEISNFSRPGHESRHNSNYWKGAWYLGIGPSAHSFNGLSRRWNVANNQKYMKGIENGEIYFEEEVLSPSDRFNELVLTGLRTVYGVSLEKLKNILPLTDEFTAKLHEFSSAGWLMEQEETIVLTREGRLKADYIASELFITE